MTVQELIIVLSKYPAHMPVFATWEGLYTDILERNFTQEFVGGEDALIIIVDDIEARIVL